MSSSPQRLTGTRGGKRLEKQLQKLESLRVSCKGICLAEPRSSTAHQRPTRMLKRAFLIRSSALAMSVALDVTQDAHKTLTVAEHRTAAALPGTTISCAHQGTASPGFPACHNLRFRHRRRTTVSLRVSTWPGNNDRSGKIPAQPRAYTHQILSTEPGRGEGRAHELSWVFRGLCWVPLGRQPAVQPVR